MKQSFFIGWDVGGWLCDRNPRSRDAIVILDAELRTVGKPWRGNLREAINTATTSQEWTARLFNLCDSEVTIDSAITMAIDTPLGFPKAFLSLATKLQSAGVIGDSPVNPYLYRYTEQLLLIGTHRPLSAIKDMIGSQATKGMHMLAKFAPRIERCGVWADSAMLKAIETYPTACRRAEVDNRALNALEPLNSDDLDDARICALVACLFATSKGAFEGPPEDVPIREGWIWVPKEGKLQELLTSKTRLVPSGGVHA